MEDNHAEAVLNTVLDCGINFIDTADCYGHSETRIGRFLSHRRDEFTLATKCGCIPNGRGWNRDNLFVGLRSGLRLDEATGLLTAQAAASAEQVAAA